MSEVQSSWTLVGLETTAGYETTVTHLSKLFWFLKNKVSVNNLRFEIPLNELCELQSDLHYYKLRVSKS